ncbi:unnamed protein product [Toxocara canis]|nr:unnamed protein product [Toxocara canis]
MRAMNSPTMTAVEANSGTFKLDAEKVEDVGGRQKDQNQEDRPQDVDDISILAPTSENQEDGAKSVDEKRRKRYLRKSKEYRKTLVNRGKNIPARYRTFARVRKFAVTISSTTAKGRRIPGRDKSLWSFHQVMAISGTTGKSMRIPGRDKSLWSFHQKNTSHKADKNSRQPDGFVAPFIDPLRGVIQTKTLIKEY